MHGKSTKLSADITKKRDMKNFIKNQNVQFVAFVILIIAELIITPIFTDYPVELAVVIGLFGFVGAQYFRFAYNIAKFQCTIYSLFYKNNSSKSNEPSEFAVIFNKLCACLMILLPTIMMLYSFAEL